MSITLLTQGGAGGGPELTSNSFTPVAGDTVLVVWCIQGPAKAFTFVTAGYTWNYSSQFTAGDTDATIGAAWAFNVPAGTKTFTTSGLAFAAITYYVLDIGAMTAQDQSGFQNTPYPSGSMVEIPTAGLLTAANEASVVWQQSQFTPFTGTPMPGYTTTTQQTNPAFGAANLIMAYNPAAGPAGAIHTGGWSVLVPSGIAGIITFKGASAYQPGYPVSGLIEEPSEGTEQSNVVPQP